MGRKDITLMAVDINFHKYLKTEAAKKGMSMLELQRELISKEQDKVNKYGF